MSTFTVGSSDSASSGADFVTCETGSDGTTSLGSGTGEVPIAIPPYLTCFPYFRVYVPLHFGAPSEF